LGNRGLAAPRTLSIEGGKSLTAQTAPSEGAETALVSAPKLQKLTDLVIFIHVAAIDHRPRHG
jgi:hypothetical protein